MRSFFGNPYAKGQYEYLEARKRQQLHITLVCAFVVAAFVGAGLIVDHTTKNILSIPGILMVLPTANFLVTYLALLKGKPLDPVKREQAREYEANGLALFHLMYVDEKGKRHYMEHVTVYQNAVVAYAPSVKEAERVALESDCITRLRKKGVSLRLKVYTDWQEYWNRLLEINKEIPEDQVKLVEKAQELMLGMSL